MSRRGRLATRCAPPSVQPPPEVRSLVAAIGEEATLRLVRAYGGIRIEVPYRVRSGGILVRVIGAVAAARLSEALPGAKFNVPLAKAWQAQHMRLDGASYSEIARALLCTERSVHQWLEAGSLTQPRQPDLLDR